MLQCARNAVYMLQTVELARLRNSLYLRFTTVAL